MNRLLRLATALLRIGFAEAVAYRTELFLWVVSTTLPFVMMALFSVVTREQRIGRFGPDAVVTYFLVTLVVRHMTSSWLAWQLSRDIRHGDLSAKLLRPVHPLLAYAAENVTAIPLRLLAALPVIAIGIFVIEPSTLAQTAASYALGAMSIVLALALSIMMALCIGAASLFLESGIKLMDFVLTLFFVASGYMIPLEMFPEAVRRALDLLPFRYQLGLSVELLTGAYDRDLPLAIEMCARQVGFIGLFGLILYLLWTRGVRRFEVYGG